MGWFLGPRGRNNGACMTKKARAGEARRPHAGRTVKRVDTMTPLATGADRTFYVNTRTRQSAEPLHWVSGCVFIAFDEAGTTHLDNEVAIMQQVLVTIAVVLLAT